MCLTAYETDNQSIGEIVCERAADLEAAAVIMAASGKGRVKEFFIGSVTNYCLHRCKRPVVIYRSPPVVRPGASSRGGKEVNETNGAHAHAGVIRKRVFTRSSRELFMMRLVISLDFFM